MIAEGKCKSRAAGRDHPILLLRTGRVMAQDGTKPSPFTRELAEAALGKASLAGNEEDAVLVRRSTQESPAAPQNGANGSIRTVGKGGEHG